MSAAHLALSARDEETLDPFAAMLGPIAAMLTLTLRLRLSVPSAVVSLAWRVALAVAAVPQPPIRCASGDEAVTRATWPIQTRVTSPTEPTEPTGLTRATRLATRSPRSAATHQPAARDVITATLTHTVAGTDTVRIVIMPGDMAVVRGVARITRGDMAAGTDTVRIVIMRGDTVVVRGVARIMRGDMVDARGAVRAIMH